MPEYIGGQSKSEKFVMFGCIALFVACIICVPFMVRDENRLAEKSWQDNGCKMYDDYEMDKVPAKCQTYFVDHYKAQQGRVQPPEK